MVAVMDSRHGATVLLMVLGVLAIAGYRSGRLSLLAQAINGGVKVGPPGSAAASAANRDALGYLLNPDPGPAVSAPGTKPAPLPGATAPSPSGTVPLPGLLTPRDTRGLVATGPSIGGTGRSGSAV